MAILLLFVLSLALASAYHRGGGVAVAVAEVNLGGEALQPSAPEKSRTDEESSTPLEEPDKEEPHQNPNPNPSSSPSERGGKSPVPYSIPPWSEPPTHRFFLEVLKDGSIIEQLDV